MQVKVYVKGLTTPTSLSFSLFTKTQTHVAHVTTKTRVVSHYGFAINIKKYLRAKNELWKFKYFTMQKQYLQKKSSEINQNLSRYHNSIINLKFQHKPKYHFSKNPPMKLDLLPRGQNALSYYTL